MDMKKKPVVRWLLAGLCLGMAIGLAACGAVTPMPAAAPFRLENGAVKVQDENHAWVPVAGETTFELAGTLESTDPWMVTGNTFAARDSTKITEGLKAGDPVTVNGVILEDATWLAESIAPSEEKIDPAVTLTGKVESVEPWVVSGIEIQVTDDTVVTGKVSPGKIVRVEILLLEDGHWDVISVTPLSDLTEVPGCSTVTATVASLNGDQVQFTGWPAIPLGENVKIEDEAGRAATLSAGRAVLLIICPAQPGGSQITRIVVLPKSADLAAQGARVLVCHKPDKKGGHTLSIPAAALPAHLRHGDKRGPCPEK